MEDELQGAVAMYKEQIEALGKAIEEDPENLEVVEIREQIQEALAEAQAALRAAFRPTDSGAGPGGCATSASAAARMDEDQLGGEEEGQEAESSAPPESEREVVEQGPEVQSRGRGGRTNNARIHPSNKYYREEPDFTALARQYPDLRPYVTHGADGRAHYEYTSWEGTRQLTATLLKHDFGIDWWLPEGQLVPTLTNRANYIHWLHDLLQLSRPEGSSLIKGLDVGCGANYIYCLLGAAIYGWRMVGCDVTDVALQWARRHVQSNPQLAPLLDVRDSRKHGRQSGGGHEEEGAGAEVEEEEWRRRKQESGGGAEGWRRSVELHGRGDRVREREEEAAVGEGVVAEVAESVAGCQVNEGQGGPLKRRVSGSGGPGRLSGSGVPVPAGVHAAVAAAVSEVGGTSYISSLNLGGDNGRRMVVCEALGAGEDGEGATAAAAGAANGRGGDGDGDEPSLGEGMPARSGAAAATDAGGSVAGAAGAAAAPPNASAAAAAAADAVEPCDESELASASAANGGGGEAAAAAAASPPTAEVASAPAGQPAGVHHHHHHALASDPGRSEALEPDPDLVGGVLTAALRGPSERFAFSMCNPPFFNSMSEACSNPGGSACGGTEAEMVYPGGELAFIMRMVDDSVRLGARIHWYTTMVGKKATLKALRKELHARHVSAIRTTEFAQGKTSRWAIAWSFEVDPALANQPLPRAVNPALAAPLKPKRLVSFMLQGPQQDGRKLLKAMEAALLAHGAAGIAVDLGMWTLTATLPSPAAAAAAAAISGAAGGAGGASSSTAAELHAQKRQRQPAVPIAGVASGGGGGGASSAGAAALAVAMEHAGGASAGGTTMRVNMYQQQRGRFDVMASIPKSTSDADALGFSAIMQKVCPVCIGTAVANAAPAVAAALSGVAACKLAWQQQRKSGVVIKRLPVDSNKVKRAALVALKEAQPNGSKVHGFEEDDA